MNINGFTETGTWYKGNLHCHSTNSDGLLKPDEVAALYKEHGYHFLAISDHDLYSDYRNELGSDTFLILPALEASAVLYEDESKTERLRIHHIHGILGTEEMQKNAEHNLFHHLEYYPPRLFYGNWDGAAVAQELQDDLKKHGCITTYNHPVWSRVREDEFIDIEGCTAMEIFNYGTVNESATGVDSLHWDVMLRKGKKIFAVASDDNHNDGIVEDSFGGYIVVKAEKLNHESIVQAIVDGNYYSSSGPEIFDWGIRDNVAYGLKHTDVDLSSAEELAMFEAEKNNATKDIGDVGETYGAVAEEKGLTLKYKTSYWDEIPDWAKDDDGDWVVAYYGTMALMTNKRLVPDAPTSFQDLLDGDYVVSIGDVAKSTRAQYAVLAAAYAMGGDESNIQPGLDFFRQLAEQGRLDKGEFNFSRIEKGEIGVAIIWDFVGIGYREQIKENNPDADFEMCIPSDCSVQSGYTTIINAYTKRPYAAALTREYILSDEGQLNLAKGYAKTVRDIDLPAELEEKMIPDNQYNNVKMVEDQEAWEETVAELPSLWNEEVMAYAK